MSKLLQIIKREYSTRVKKRAFIVMTILGPLFLAMLILSTVWIAKFEENKEKTIAVIDSTKIFINTIPNTKYLKFEYLKSTKLEDIKAIFHKTNYYAILYIPENIFSDIGKVIMYSDREVHQDVKMHISNSLEKQMERLKLQSRGIDWDILLASKSTVKILSISLDSKGKDKDVLLDNIRKVVGIMASILIYLFIFTSSTQVMRSTIEEKTSRVLEIMISSVRPIQIMMGKIIAVGLVAFTQFLIWIILAFIIVVTYKSVFVENIPTQIKESQELLSSSSSLQQIQTIKSQSLDDVKNIFSSVSIVSFEDLFGIVLTFLFYFIAGYLLYASLFAAIGSAVDSETDTQQFLLPVTLPMIISLISISFVISNPHSSLAFWLSIIPFTSPIIMMVRLPFGNIPIFPDVVLSVVSLILFIIITNYLAAKIYRVGILMYGKKFNYKELWKWLKY